ncbi:MAG: response regulator [Bryobacterales bacterium]|nr:response regulator [Bryobacterales bacterium]
MKKPRVLVVEDNAINRMVVERLVGKRGWPTVSVGDGYAALTECRRQAFDLILMDIRLPGMSGLDAAEQIRALPGCENVPMLALTAGAAAEDRQQCFDSGFDGYCTKPFGKEQLFERIEAVLAARRDPEI